MSKTLQSFALEGIGGSGKSHVGQIVTTQLINSGLKVLNYKVAGLGNSPRVSWLKSIMWHRHKLRTEEFTPKQMKSKLRERIFRLAMKQQIKDFYKENYSAYDCAIIDRTPLMIWVFAKANNPNNPYLDEIYQEVVFFTRNLNLTKVYLFDARPETAYARMIARYCMGKENWKHMVVDACNIIQSPPSSSKEIVESVSNLILSKSIQPKEFESWDLIPFEVTQREREIHRLALGECNRLFGLNYEVVNADRDIDIVVTSLRESILRSMQK